MSEVLDLGKPRDEYLSGRKAKRLCDLLVATGYDPSIVRDTAWIHRISKRVVLGYSVEIEGFRERDLDLAVAFPEDAELPVTVKADRFPLASFQAVLAMISKAETEADSRLEEAVRVGVVRPDGSRRKVGEPWEKPDPFRGVGIKTLGGMQS
jgi:hypothetical protein